MNALRCRLGAWLLRPHVTALLEHYNEMASQTDPVRASRCQYISIGIKHAIGYGVAWRKWDW